jgi:hypothetical protein
LRGLAALVVIAMVAVGCGDSSGGRPVFQSYPADHDAITVLASTATQVAIETVTGPCVLTTTGFQPCLTNLKTVLILQDNHNPGFGDVTPQHIHDLIAVQLFDEFKAKPGYSYLVFASFDRGMLGCISALYRYNVNSKTATFVKSFDGPVSGKIRLSRRTLKLPRTMSLNYGLARMNPIGGQVFPADTGESWCPGP